MLPPKNEYKVLIPARAGSKGIKKKNLKKLQGVALIEHTINFAKKFFSNSNIYISTDDLEIVEIGTKSEIQIPFIRPSNLAQDDTPMHKVLTHFIENVEMAESNLILLDPTSPIRDPYDFKKALDLFENLTFNYDGIISVSRPAFNPIWTGVRLDTNKKLSLLFPNSTQYTRRQQIETIYRINGNFYFWRNRFLAQLGDSWISRGLFFGLEINDFTSFSIDTLEEFEILERLLNAKIFDLNGNLYDF